MRKQVLRLGLLGVGIVLMGLLIGQAFGDDAATVAGRAPAPAEVTPGGVPESAQPAAAEPIRDPFESQEAAAVASAPMVEAVTDIKVDGVGIGSRSAYAILNGEAILEGETKNGIKLIHAGKEELILMVNGSIRKIKLAPEDEIQRLQKMKEQKLNQKAGL